MPIWQMCSVYIVSFIIAEVLYIKVCYCTIRTRHIFEISAQHQCQASHWGLLLQYHCKSCKATQHNNVQYRAIWPSGQSFAERHFLTCPAFFCALLAPPGALKTAPGRYPISIPSILPHIANSVQYHLIMISNRINDRHKDWHKDRHKDEHKDKHKDRRIANLKQIQRQT